MRVLRASALFVEDTSPSTALWVGQLIHQYITPQQMASQPGVKLGVELVGLDRS